MKFHAPYIVFELTQACNLDCRFCYNIWKRPDAPAHEHADWTYAQAKKTLARLFKTADVDHVSLTGGEPFLGERMAEIVLYCRMKKKSVSIISNGTVGNRETYRTLISLGVQLFQFPLHSDNPEEHDNMTRTDGSWKKSVESIKEVQSFGGLVAAVIVVTKINCASVRRPIELARKLGIRQILLNRMNIGGRAIEQMKEIAPDRVSLNRAFSEAEVVAARHPDLRISANVCTPQCILDPARYPHIRFSACAVSERKMPLTIDASGYVRVCNHSPVVLGNIYSSDLETMLSSSYMREWDTSVPEFCAGCVKFSACHGGCRAAAEQIGLPLSKPDPVVFYDL